MTLAAWLHTFDPFIVQFTETFGLRWYGTAYLAGFVLAYVLLTALARRGLVLIPASRVGDAMMWLVGGVLIGGRLGYVLVYQPSLLWTFFDAVPWWGLLAINEGGMASHGGIAGVILAAWRISRGWNDERGRRVGVAPPPHVMDVTALLAPFGLFFGRLANFINGELLGRIVTPPGVEGPRWTVQFPQELKGWERPGVRSPHGHAPALSPEQEASLRGLAESVAQPGDTWGRAIDRLIANASDHAAQLKPLLSSRHPSQLYQAVAEGVVLGLVVWLVWARPRKPGVVGCWFLITYGVLRIATEVYRLPDPQFAEGRPWGLSRGQWLSVATAAAGVGLLIWCVRRPGAKLGGWWRGRRERPGDAAPSGS